MKVHYVFAALATAGSLLLSACGEHTTSSLMPSTNTPTALAPTNTPRNAPTKSATPVATATKTPPTVPMGALSKEAYLTDSAGHASIAYMLNGKRYEIIVSDDQGNPLPDIVITGITDGQNSLYWVVDPTGRHATLIFSAELFGPSETSGQIVQPAMGHSNSSNTGRVGFRPNVAFRKAVKVIRVVGDVVTLGINLSSDNGKSADGVVISPANDEITVEGLKLLLQVRGTTVKKTSFYTRSELKDYLRQVARSHLVGTGITLAAVWAGCQGGAGVGGLVGGYAGTATLPIIGTVGGAAGGAIIGCAVGAVTAGILVDNAGVETTGTLDIPTLLSAWETLSRDFPEKQRFTVVEIGAAEIGGDVLQTYRALAEKLKNITARSVTSLDPADTLLFGGKVMLIAAIEPDSILLSPQTVALPQIGSRAAVAATAGYAYFEKAIPEFPRPLDVELVPSGIGTVKQIDDPNLTLFAVSREARFIGSGDKLVATYSVPNSTYSISSEASIVSEASPSVLVQDISGVWEGRMSSGVNWRWVLVQIGNKLSGTSTGTSTDRGGYALVRLDGTYDAQSRTVVLDEPEFIGSSLGAWYLTQESGTVSADGLRIEGRWQRKGVPFVNGTFYMDRQ
jgi:hypothetical protein